MAGEADRALFGVPELAHRGNSRSPEGTGRGARAPEMKSTRAKSLMEIAGRPP